MIGFFAFYEVVEHLPVRYFIKVLLLKRRFSRTVFKHFIILNVSDIIFISTSNFKAKE